MSVGFILFSLAPAARVRPPSHSVLDMEGDNNGNAAEDDIFGSLSVGQDEYALAPRASRTFGDLFPEILLAHGESNEIFQTDAEFSGPSKDQFSTSLRLTIGQLVEERDLLGVDCLANDIRQVVDELVPQSVSDAVHPHRVRGKRYCHVPVLVEWRGKRPRSRLRKIFRVKNANKFLNNVLGRKKRTPLVSKPNRSKTRSIYSVMYDGPPRMDLGDSEVGDEDLAVVTDWSVEDINNLVGTVSYCLERSWPDIVKAMGPEHSRRVPEHVMEFWNGLVTEANLPRRQRKSGTSAFLLDKVLVIEGDRRGKGKKPKFVDSKSEISGDSSSCSVKGSSALFVKHTSPWTLDELRQLIATVTIYHVGNWGGVSMGMASERSPREVMEMWKELVSFAAKPVGERQSTSSSEIGRLTEDLLEKVLMLEAASGV